MKKKLVLFILFIFPLAAYLFFASGINSFGKLPTITNNISDIQDFKLSDGSKVTLNKKITILSFIGTNVIYNQGNYFNLTEQIYTKNKDFLDFQFVIIVPKESEKEIALLVKKLSKVTDISPWKFVYGTTPAIKKFHKSLHLKNNLDKYLGSKYVYIIDKNRNLRGRDAKKDYKEGYDTTSPADLHNEMTDDVKIILAEYRFALKKNKNKQIDLDHDKK